MAASPADPRPVNDHAGGFDAMYAGRPPWDIGRPQAALVALDCGLFHLSVFTEEDRASYVASLRSVLRRGGRYFMLCFSDREPGITGPLRLTQDQIRTAFADGWQIDSIEPTTLEITTDPAGVRAWLVTATRN